MQIGVILPSGGTMVIYLFPSPGPRARALSVEVVAVFRSIGLSRVGKSIPQIGRVPLCLVPQRQTNQALN